MRVLRIDFGVGMMNESQNDLLRKRSTVVFFFYGSMSDQFTCFFDLEPLINDRPDKFSVAPSTSKERGPSMVLNTGRYITDFSLSDTVTPHYFKIIFKNS